MYLDWIATVLSLIGAFLVARKRVEGFVVWMPAAILWILIGIQKQTYGLAILNIVYFLMDIYAIYNWKR